MAPPGDDIAELYKRHAPALHRRCASIVGNPDEARDLVQETFARYLSSRGTFDRASPFTALYRLATNAAIDRLRHRKTAELHTGELHDLALRTRGLPEEEVTVAVLHHLDGYTQEG